MPTPLERTFGALFAVSQRGVILFGVLFVIYILTGGIGYLIGAFNPAYSFLGLESDPFFNLFVTFLSFFLVTQSLATIVLDGILEPRGRNFDIVVILSAIAIGFGAAAFAATYATTFKFLRDVVVRIVTAGAHSSLAKLHTLVA